MRSSILALVVTLSACNSPEIKQVEFLDDGALNASDRCVPDPPKVDVLLVIDDSPSMAQEQAALAENLRAFAEVYEDPSRALDYRIAVTTTSIASEACSGPERDGRLIAGSCRQTLEAFVTGETHEGEAADLRDVCLEHCPLETLPLLGFPWLQRAFGEHNFTGTSAPEMLACMGLVGIAGCTFEAPLEAARRALVRMQDENDPSFGFLRPAAGLVIVFIGDEDDCSIREEFAEFFTPDGPATFWEDGAAGPTSAACWNAGVACVGDPDGYDSCLPTNRGPDGGPASRSDAVLHPVDELVELLRNIERQKQSATASLNQRVFVSAVAGVPQGYGNGAELFYADAADAAMQAAFGIGPGCASGESLAFPPVRTLAVVEEFAPFDADVVSVCNGDWQGALACIPGGWDPPTGGCIGTCLEDQDPSTPTLDPTCVVSETVDGKRTVLPSCELVQRADGRPVYAIADGEEVCAVILVDDSGLTLSGHDDMGQECVDSGGSAELRVLRREQPWRGSCLSAQCALASNPKEACG